MTEEKKTYKQSFAEWMASRSDKHRRPNWAKESASRLVPGADPIARALALKLRAVRTARNITQPVAAKQLGLLYKTYVDLEMGKYIPVIAIQHRIYAWAAEGKTFPEYPQNPLKAFDKDYPHGRETITLKLPKKVMHDLSIFSANMGFTQELSVMIAIYQLMESPGALKTYEQAQDRLIKTQLAEIFADDNFYLKHFFDLEIDVAKTMGVTLVPYGKSKKLFIEKLLDDNNIDLPVMEEWYKNYIVERNKKNMEKRKRKKEEVKEDLTWQEETT